jgi:hypothetical protein
MRDLSLSEQAYGFLILVDAAGSIPRQSPSRFVSLLAKDVYDVVFDYIPSGRLLENPVYQGLDPDFPGYSRYVFSHGRVRGAYSSTASHVILLELRIVGELPAELEGLPQLRQDVA